MCRFFTVTSLKRRPLHSKTIQDNTIILVPDANRSNHNNPLTHTPKPNVYTTDTAANRPRTPRNKDRINATKTETYTTVTAPVTGRPFAPPPDPFLPAAASCLHHRNTPARDLPRPPPPAPPAPPARGGVLPSEREISRRRCFSSCSCSNTC